MALCPPDRRTFSDERGPGTFHSLGDLPKRRHDVSSRKFPVFHLPHDDNDDHSSLDEASPQPIPPPALRSSSPSSLSPSPISTPTSTPRPQLFRGTSVPILLSNGKPLKSSLKSSPSSPVMATYPQSHHIHLRARSEPSTPVISPKNVHFPEKDYALATVRVFNRSARPAALSSTANGNGDETETDGDETPPARFPFPPSPPTFNYEIDPARSSPIPSAYSPPTNVLLESLNFPSSSSSSSNRTMKPLLTGFILVRNLAFEKRIAIRFTLDDWQTVSEVGAHYVESLSVLPSQAIPTPLASTLGDTRSQRGRGWDRFTFIIRLEDYVHSLSTRTLWLAVRYSVNSTYPDPGSAHYGPGGEWWDNNGGANYRVGFRPTVPTLTISQDRPRRETFSAPIPSPRTKPRPVMACKEHALGHMVLSVPQRKGTQPVNETDMPSIPLRAGKLNLCNYASPTVCASPSVVSPRRLSPSSTTNLAPPPSAALQSSSDDDTASPASSNLSTPSVSPTITPRVMINGQPATDVYPQYSRERDRDAITPSSPKHISDWEWTAPGKPRIKGPLRPCTDHVPDSVISDLRRDIPSSLGRRALIDSSNSLYDTLVTQWCFAQGPSPEHGGYDGGGIMA